MNKFIGHYSPQVIGVAFIVSMSASLAFNTLSPSMGFWWVYLFLSAALMILAIYAWLRMRAHSRGLCELCADSLARMPSNPSKAAERRKYILLSIHLPTVVIIGYLVALMSFDLYVVNSVTGGTVLLFVFAAVNASLLYLLYAYEVHQKLQPWCPKCGEGGEEVSVPPRKIPLGSSH
jgi:hypothetical protein